VVTAALDDEEFVARCRRENRAGLEQLEVRDDVTPPELSAPTDVRLDAFTVVQPDVLVVCDAAKLANGRYVDGVPDLVVKVLAPSNALKDRREKRRVVLVFDGSPPPGVSYGADVLFSGPGRKADALILEILRGESDPRGWTVITNDRSLADQCRFVGAHISPVKAFREQLRPDASAEKPDQPDVDYWLSQFGDE